jgi:hypothetical protein
MEAPQKPSTEGANMEFVVTIDGESAFGAVLMALHQKIGGASATMAAGIKTHPLILCRDLDAASMPGFVRMTQLQNPGTGDQSPRVAIVPSRSILPVHEYLKTPGKPPAPQETKLH